MCISERSLEKDTPDDLLPIGTAERENQHEADTDSELPSDNSSFIEFTEENQSEAGLDSDDPLDNLESSEEDYPVDEGSGDILVNENTGLYPLPIAQGGGGIEPPGLSNQIVVTDKVFEDSGSILQ